MADVYRAWDTRLERYVALKVLPPEAAAKADHLGRFRREARALASLEHPNVVTVYSVDEAEGLHFLVMALVRGRSLDRLIPDGGMHPGELLPIVCSIAEGVSAAHAHGIIHRDLKPANVMVTGDGQVKIVDFGLAKITTRPDRSIELTDVGAAVGTVPYMSPEQLKGAQTDARSDIFSLGVVMHQMANGRLPFPGESAAEVISAILNDAPQPFRGPCLELLPRFEGVVERCLHKDPEARYSSVGELLRELAVLPERPRAAPPEPALLATPRAESRLPLPARPSLAVLPFRNLGIEPEYRHLATALWFELNAELVKLAGLFLLNGTSTATLERRQVDPRKLGKEIGVRHLLEGSVHVCR